MKGRPNNISKQVMRSKSPTLPLTTPSSAPPKPSPDITSAFYPELTRLTTPDPKPRLPSPDPPTIKKTPISSHEQKLTSRETTVRSYKIETNGKKDEDDNTTEQSSSQHLSYVTGQYQLDTYDLFSRRKNVKFQERVHELQRNDKGRVSGDKNSSRNSSILKNSSRVLDRSIASSEKSLSIQNSFTAVKKCSIALTAPQDTANSLARKKYESIVQQMKGRQQKEKYIDELFPPVQASIFTTSVHKKGNISRGKDEIVWMRLSEIFPGATKVFSKTNEIAVNITKGEKGYAEPYFVSSLNAIKNKTDLLAFMFQSEQSNPYGVYLVKIYQQNSWKNVIVDDLIPCIRRRSRREQKYAPIFINTLTSQGPPPLWPYLLEKAYANYYSCYQNLCWGNPVDFLTQLTGVPYKEILFNTKRAKQGLQKSLSNLASFFTTTSAIAIGWNEEKNQYYPLALLKETFTGENVLLGLHDPSNNYQPLKVELTSLPNALSAVYLYPYGEQPNCTSCPVYPPKLAKEKPPRRPKQKQERVRYLQIPANDTTSLRTFTIFKKTKCCLNVRQKQMRFYSQCGISQYLWVRCLFLQKEYDGGYRWVAGRYDNRKHIVFEEVLDPGEYFLVITVEWRERYNKELTVLLYSDCEFLKFERRNYVREQRMVELACMDLAQRYGKLNQINKSICSYTLLCEDTALIIENIVNERTKGEVTIMRSIAGLKSKVEILPMNGDFEVDGPEQYGALEKGEGRKVLTQSVEIDIQKGESFTVVLRMRGGVDRKFFKVFNFG